MRGCEGQESVYARRQLADLVRSCHEFSLILRRNSGLNRMSLPGQDLAISGRSCYDYSRHATDGMGWTECNRLVKKKGRTAGLVTPPGGWPRSAASRHRIVG